MKFHSRWAATALFIVASGLSTLTHAAAVSGQGTWETTLQGRDLDGNLSTVEAYYDTSLNITWLANANYGGMKTWANANSWVAGLVINGFAGWRLPSVVDSGASGCNFSYSGTDCGYNVDTATGEMAHMFYTTLGNKAYYSTSGSGPQPGFGLTNTGPFSNIQSDYWSGTDYAPNTSYVWFFGFQNGMQGAGSKIGPALQGAWVVHQGNIGAAVPAPVPAAFWLFGSGLVGLIGMARRKAA